MFGWGCIVCCLWLSRHLWWRTTETKTNFPERDNKVHRIVSYHAFSSHASPPGAVPELLLFKVKASVWSAMSPSYCVLGVLLYIEYLKKSSLGKSVTCLFFYSFVCRSSLFLLRNQCIQHPDGNLKWCLWQLYRCVVCKSASWYFIFWTAHFEDKIHLSTLHGALCREGCPG